jgi:ATP-dependent RNA helicase DeaD
MSQEQRDRVTKKLRQGVAELLIATDVAARGLDIEHLSHVFNYDVPSSPDMYVHRIGRTGRAGREGVAITLAEPREYRLLRNIEQFTKQRLQMETVPTVVDLKARRLELTRVAIREAILSGELDSYRVVVESLSEEFDVCDVATAAVKLVHLATGSEVEEEDIPVVRPPRDRPETRSAELRGGSETRGERPKRSAKGKRPGFEVARLFIGAGRKLGVRPADLVGAIANEAGIDSRAIGAIDIADRFSLVEVPDDAADEIIAALRSSTIKGRRVHIRRDRGPNDREAGSE